MGSLGVKLPVVGLLVVGSSAVGVAVREDEGSSGAGVMVVGSLVVGRTEGKYVGSQVKGLLVGARIAGSAI